MTVPARFLPSCDTNPIGALRQSGTERSDNVSELRREAGSGIVHVCPFTSRSSRLHLGRRSRVRSSVRRPQGNAQFTNLDRVTFAHVLASKGDRRGRNPPIGLDLTQGPAINKPACGVRAGFRAMSRPRPTPYLPEKRPSP